MNKNLFIIFSILVVLLAVNFISKPILRERDANRVAAKILDSWKNNDLTVAMGYWENPSDSPPIYGLDDYMLTETKLSKVDGEQKATVTAILDFPPNNTSPSGKKWNFELKKTPYGWKVKNFSQDKSF